MKELNEQQVRCLFNDILNNDVKRLVKYEFNGYVISITEPLEKELKEERRKRFNEYKKNLYHDRKSKNLCVRCGNKAMKNRINCKKCNDRIKKNQNAKYLERKTQ